MNQEQRLLQYNEIGNTINKNMVLNTNFSINLHTNGEWGRIVGITCLLFDLKEYGEDFDGQIEAETLNKVITFVSDKFNVDLTYWVDINNMKVMYIIKSEFEEIKEEAKEKYTI